MRGELLRNCKTAAGPTKGEAAPSTETTSSIWRIEDDGGLLVEEVQTFRSFGAHGVAHITSEGSHYLAVSMYYADFVAVLKWDGSRFEEHQRLPCEGGGGICAFVVDGQHRLAVAEFGKKGVSLFGLDSDKFHHLQLPTSGRLLPYFNSFPQQAHVLNRMCQLVLDDEVAHGVDRVYIDARRLRALLRSDWCEGSSRLPIKVGTSASSPNIKIPTGLAVEGRPCTNGDGASTSWYRNWTTTTARTARVCSRLPMVNYTWRLPAAATARRSLMLEIRPSTQISLGQEIVVRRQESPPGYGCRRFCSFAIWGDGRTSQSRTSRTSNGGQRRVGRLGGDVTVVATMPPAMPPTLRRASAVRRGRARPAAEPQTPRSGAELGACPCSAMKDSAAMGEFEAPMAAAAAAAAATLESDSHDAAARPRPGGRRQRQKSPAA